MGLLGFNFNLLDQLAFYGAYHNNPWNQAIHFVFVPAIYWTVAVWLAYTPAVNSCCDLPSALAPHLGKLASGFAVNGACTLSAAYTLYYLLLDPLAGLSWGVCIGLPVWVTSNLFQQAVDKAWAWALALHLFGWYMQIHPGHALLEKRRPALLDSFGQSLVLAPLFVWYELLFLLGYRPALHAQLQQRVTADIAAWKAGAAAAAGATAPLLSGDGDAPGAGKAEGK